MAFYQIQAQNFSLSGSGCSIGDTVLNLKSFKDINGVNITMSDLGAIGWITVEPGNGTQEEQISFTGVTQNTDGSAQLTGVSTVLFKTPYTATSGFSKTHPGSVVAILSNTAGFYTQFGVLADDQVITGNWTVPDPTGSLSIANKEYVLSVVNGGPVSVNSVIPAGTAGETVAAGNVVYLKVSDGRWYLAKANDNTKIFGVQLGIAQGAGTAGNAITGGVLVAGYDSNQSALVSGTTYYTSDTGTVSSSAGTITRIIGQGGQSATKLYFNPNYTGSSVTQNNAMVQANSSGLIDKTYLAFNSTNVTSFNSGTNASATTYWSGVGTWTDPHTVATSLIPLPNYLTSGSTTNEINTNTVVYAYQIVVPFKITANQVSIYATAKAVNGTYKLAMFSEDGQTQLWTVQTATISGAGIVTTALSAVVIQPGLYYIAIVPVGTADVTFLGHNPASNIGGLTTVSSKNTIAMQVTVSAGTMPATLSPSGASAGLSNDVVIRLDN